MNYYEKIKNKLIDVEIQALVKDYSKNKYTLEKYYEIGKLLIEAQGGESRAKYGDKLIKEYSKKLTNELGKGYSVRMLKYIRKYYQYQKGHTVCAQLSWSHYKLLLGFEANKIEYYVNKCTTNNISVRKLSELIKSREYERLPEDTKNKLVNNEEPIISDLVPNPIVIRNKNNIEMVTEKALHNLILENIESFMKELGDLFCFIGSEYKIKIGDRNHHIDLLFFNVKFNCFVVVELKVTEFKVEYISQVQKYMNFVDKNIKKVINNSTIGIIICKRENNFIIEYCSDERIAVREYQIL